MAIWGIVEGNLAKQPEMKTVKVDGQPKQIVELSLFSDVRRKSGDEWVQDDEKSGYVEATIWQEKLGEAVFKHLTKGARVEVKGDIHLHRYTNSAGQQDSIQRISADSVTLALYRIENITFKPSRRAQQQAEPADA